MIEDEVEHAAEFVFESSSQTVNYEKEDDDVVSLRSTSREGIAPSTYTPSAYDNRDHSRGHTWHPRGG
jgi:hypothetical protein